MAIPRVYQALPLKEGKTLELSLEASHYLGSVRRLHEGDSLILFNGEGGEYRSKISAIHKKSFVVTILSFQDTTRESPLALTLAQGVARGEKMDFIVQKAVELGVQKIIPVFTERCTVKLDNEKRIKRREHWQMVANSACEQCGRNTVPEVLMPLDFGLWLKTVTGLGLILSPTGEDSISTLQLSTQDNPTLLIGPEGGLTEEEEELCLRQGFKALKLGPRILRTETAPLAVLAALQTRFGDLG